MRDVRRSTAAAASSERGMRLLLLLGRLPVVLLGLVGQWPADIRRSHAAIRWPCDPEGTKFRVQRYGLGSRSSGGGQCLG
jgi:hypothetical protein